MIGPGTVLRLKSPAGDEGLWTVVEAWQEIPNTYYSVSSQGRVASRRDGGWRIMRSPKNGRGYPNINLSVGGRLRNFRVHGLVATAFLGPRPSAAHEVNHIDGDKTNNAVSNLEWVTRSQNERHAIRVLGKAHARGTANANAKLDSAKVFDIRARLGAGDAKAHIAKLFGVSAESIAQVARRETWAWVG